VDTIERDTTPTKPAATPCRQAEGGGRQAGKGQVDHSRVHGAFPKSGTALAKRAALVANRSEN